MKNAFLWIAKRDGAFLFLLIAVRGDGLNLRKALQHSSTAAAATSSLSHTMKDTLTH